nr:hypothetical protein [Aquisalimonas sp.]
MGSLLAALAPFLLPGGQVFQQLVEQRHEQQRQGARGDHAAHHRGADLLTADG